MNYLSNFIYHASLILAPRASNLAFSSSASSFTNSFLSHVGLDSTHSFASLRPKPKVALTSLINLIFVAAVNSVSSTS